MKVSSIGFEDQRAGDSLPSLIKVFVSRQRIKASVHSNNRPVGILYAAHWWLKPCPRKKCTSA